MTFIQEAQAEPSPGICAGLCAFPCAVQGPLLDVVNFSAMYLAFLV